MPTSQSSPSSQPSSEQVLIWYIPSGAFLLNNGAFTREPKEARKYSLGVARTIYSGPDWCLADLEGNAYGTKAKLIASFAQNSSAQQGQVTRQVEEPRSYVIYLPGKQAFWHSTWGHTFDPTLASRIKEEDFLRDWKEINALLVVTPAPVESLAVRLDRLADNLAFGSAGAQKRVILGLRAISKDLETRQVKDCKSLSGELRKIVQKLSGWSGTSLPAARKELELLAQRIEEL